MSTGSKDLAGIRSLYDEQQDYVPLDTNIAEGLAVAFSNTSGDNRSIVLPSHANALLAGRAFAGISAEVGSPVLAQDTSWATQRSGIAKCALKDSTACTRGGIAAYDPADLGKVVPYTSAVQVPIGEFLQTLSSGTSQMVGVALFKGGFAGKSLSMIGKIAGVSSTVTNTAAETAYDKTVSIPANLLNSGSVVRIRGNVLCLNNGANGTVVKVYWGSTAIASSASLTPSANDIYNFDLVVDIRSATTAWAYGFQTTFAAVGTAAYKGTGAALTVDTTVANTISVKVTYGGASANDQTALESLIVNQDGSSAF